MNESSGWFGVSQLVVHGLINAGSPNSSHPYGIVPTARSGCGGGGSAQCSNVGYWFRYCRLCMHAVTAHFCSRDDRSVRAR
jgi:hypothetical protein